MTILKIVLEKRSLSKEVESDELPELYSTMIEPSADGQEMGKRRFLEAAAKATPEQRALFIEAARRDLPLGE